MKRNVCVVITARASYSRIKTALLSIHRHQALTLQLVVCGSAVLDKYGSLIQQIQKDGLPITASFSTILEGSSPANSVKTVSLAMVELTSIFSQFKPDIVVTIADRFETIATATAAAFMNIPLAHIQGGEVTGNIDDKVRNAITQLSDFHLVATKKAQNRVVSLGVKSERVFDTGCPSIDIALQVLQNPKLDFDPFALYGGVGIPFNPNSGYVVVMQHPVTTEYLDAEEQINHTLVAIQNLGLPAFWFWPNPDPGTDSVSRALRAHRENHSNSAIRFFKTMQPHHFLKLIKNSLCLVGNSSVGIRECASLGIPVVNIGSRQTGRDRAQNVTNAPYHAYKILKAIQEQIAHGPYPSNSLYGDGDAGWRIAEILSKITLNSSKSHV